MSNADGIERWRAWGMAWGTRAEADDSEPPPMSLPQHFPSPVQESTHRNECEPVSPTRHQDVLVLVRKKFLKYLVGIPRQDPFFAEYEAPTSDLTLTA